MPRDKQLEIAGTEDLIRAIRQSAHGLRQRYENDPVALAERFHLRLPKKPLQVMEELGVYDEEKHGPIYPGLRDLIEDVCGLQVRSAAVVGPRGGGKSQGVSFIEFFLVFLKMYDALNLGGSELQADQVYQYLLAYIESDEEWQKLVKGDTMRERTYTTDDAWIRVLTASQKSVRSPHAGGRKKGGRMAGGLLVIDEEAEAAPEIVEAALPTVNTARPSVVVRSSTFHNNEGTFAELIEDHEAMGFKLYRWDIFDVCERCDCSGDECESPEPCFRSDHFEEYVDPDTGVQERKLIHKAYCGGRAKYADGWIPMEEVVTLWKRMRRNHNRWEVEAMGSRPTTSGYVIRDRVKYQQNVTDASANTLYVKGFPVTICVDWGAVAAGVEVWQEQLNDRHVLLHAEQVEEAGISQILGVIEGLALYYGSDLTEVAADIGGGGNYLNPKLAEMGYPVRDVNFAEEKEAAAAAWNVYNEALKITYPMEFEDFHRQAKKWKRKNGRIQKGDDHLCDTALCYFAKFIERLGLANVRVVPRAFSSGMSGPTAPATGPGRLSAKEHAPRVALVRTLGSGRRR